MDRGFGEIEYVQGFIPDWLATPIGLLTQLGDVWFLALLLVVLYWFRTTSREAIAVVGGLALAGLSLLDVLKHSFSLPRPDQSLLPVETLPVVLQPLYEATAFAAGYGFPSGHALMTTIVYVGLAEILSVGTRNRRFLAAGMLVVTVSLSRIALGVHYLVDVVAGVGLGLVFLVVTGTLLTRVSDRGTTAFGLAIILAGANLIVGTADADAIHLAGASLGAFAGWQLVIVGRKVLADDPRSTALRSHRRRVLAAVVSGVPLIVALGFDPFTSSLARSGLLGLGVAVGILVPLLREAGRVQT